MAIEIQEIGPGRTSEFFSIILGAMGRRIDPQLVDHALAVDEYIEQLAALDDDHIVATAGAFDFDMSIPGGDVPIAGLTVVATLPTHRRRGIMRQLVERHLTAARERGRLASSLWASESTIYGRFGYGIAAYGCHIDIERQHAQYLGTLADPGAVRLIDVEEAAERFPPIWEEARVGVPGMMSRSESWWIHRRLVERTKSDTPTQRAVLERDGRDAAYALYRLSSKFDEPHGLLSGGLEIVEAVGRTTSDTLAMWRYLLDIDLVDRITASFLPVDHPLVFALADSRRLRQSLSDTIWLRILDVAGMLAARTYGATETLILGVTDPLFPDNDGSYRVDGAGQTVDRVRTKPDIELDVQALGSIYLGGFRCSQLVGAGRAHERTPGAAARADVLFASPRAPWQPEIF